MSARKSRQAREARREAAGRPPTRGGHRLRPDQVAALPAMVRRQCTSCGSGRIVWGTVAEVLTERVAAGEDVGPLLAELREAFGVGGDQVLNLDAWECRDCGEQGYLGAWEAL